MSKFKRYPAYKDSGVEWLGEVPEHWEVKDLKHSGQVFPSNVDKKSYEGQLPVLLCNYTDVYYNEEIVDGMELMQATATEDQIKKFSLRAGDVIFTKDSETACDIAIAAYVPKDLPGVICGYHLSMMRPGEFADGSFIKRFLDSLAAKFYFSISANGLTRVGLSQYATDNIPVSIPPLAEQIKIARFLDHETARIDALIAEQKRLIELLKEKRQAVISHAVTKGLDPTVPMKDSGVEWLGEVPAHWKFGALRWYATNQGGIAKGKDYEGRETVSVPYLRVANVQNGFVDLGEIKEITVVESEIERYSLRAGDVLMNEGGDNDKLGRGAVWRGQIEPCLHQNHVFAIRPNHQLSAEWLTTFTQSEQARVYFFLNSRQSTNLASISTSNVMSLSVPLPSISDQQTILEYLECDRKRHENLMREVASSIGLLQERRSALISAAVTGKIDVRDWQPPARAQTPELEEAEAV